LLEQPEAEWKQLLSSAVGQEAEIADPHKARWQEVEQKASQELIDREAHNPLAVAMGRVSPAECDIAISERK
jgi:hypothetical protein